MKRSYGFTKEACECMKRMASDDCNKCNDSLKEMLECNKKGDGE